MANKPNVYSVSQETAQIIDRLIAKITDENPTRVKPVNASEAIAIAGIKYLGEGND